MDTPRGYDGHLCKRMQCLRYSIAPVYRAREFGFGDRDEWEASSISSSPITATPQGSPQSRTSLVRHFFAYTPNIGSSLKRTEFTHHAYRGEDDTFCTVHDTPCCFNLIVSRLARWAEAADDCHEEVLLELSEQQGHLGEQVVDQINLTHTHQ
ncbi:hypothetical protein E2562_026350 [Oryza meyeriana var. granulata]|uniref:Uncharacterized protein n=1 Tax=Oryza meyeriana var. granulata TaxID=110450 RepID=A0A6G1EZ86_9ORYZ|nr:hypothetical protein E2562_026350 [Oryza meyeriana var. granulata]